MGTHNKILMKLTMMLYRHVQNFECIALPTSSATTILHPNQQPIEHPNESTPLSEAGTIFTTIDFELHQFALNRIKWCIDDYIVCEVIFWDFYSKNSKFSIS